MTREEVLQAEVEALRGELRRNKTDSALEKLYLIKVNDGLRERVRELELLVARGRSIAARNVTAATEVRQ